MKAGAHIRVAQLATEAMPSQYRMAVERFWEGIEMGATLPDEFLLYSDTDDQEGINNQVLMHRCFVDSEKARDKGAPIQAARYAAAVPDFAEQYASGEMEGAYDEDEFLINAGAFLGVASHHIADLHSPPHVGQALDVVPMGFRNRGHLHRRVEMDLDRAAKLVETIAPYSPRLLEMGKADFETMAQSTYERVYLALPALYRPGADKEKKTAILAECVREAARRTADVWNSVLTAISPEAMRKVVGT